MGEYADLCLQQAAGSLDEMEALQPTWRQRLRRFFARKSKKLTVAEYHVTPRLIPWMTATTLEDDMWLMAVALPYWRRPLDQGEGTQKKRVQARISAQAKQVGDDL